jgi:LTXXQ motif family protein
MRSDTEWVKPPKQDECWNSDQERGANGMAEVGGYRHQEREGVGVDDHDVDEARRHEKKVVLESRNQNEDDEYHKRQCSRQAGSAQHRELEKIKKTPGEDEGRLGDDVDLGPQHDGKSRNMDRRHDGSEPPFNGRREANTIPQEGDSGWHRRLSRDSPDDSRTNVNNSSAFPAPLEGRREVWAGLPAVQFACSEQTVDRAGDRVDEQRGVRDTCHAMPPARQAAVNDRINAMLQTVRTVPTALNEFYSLLSDEQKATQSARRARW